MTYNLFSWNVNGVRAAWRKGLFDWLLREQPDVLAMQETKCDAAQLPGTLTAVPGYKSFWASAQRKGYSGVGVYSRVEPISTVTGLGEPRWDDEGRVIVAEYEHFILYNVYFPNGRLGPERLAYKMAFYDGFLELMARRRQEPKPVVICGDVNTAHREIDLARPGPNSMVSGFLPEERAWIDKLLSVGFLDSLRLFDQSPGRYTWWDLKSRARERNVGWRIDYFFVDQRLKTNLEEAFIRDDVFGSDHCPIGIRLSF
jgi:exodeoxyribonuclease-3